MPDPDFFSRLGVFVVKSFLDAELCQQICSEVRLSNTSKAGLTSRGVDRVDEAIRRTKVAKTSDKTKLLIKRRLSEIQPRLEKHFNLALTDCEKPQFLIYKKRRFFSTTPR